MSIEPVLIETSINSYGDKDKVYSDTSMTFDWPAYVEYIPKKIHPSGSWHKTSSTSANMLTIGAPQGSIMDVVFQGIPNVSHPTNGYVASLTAATIGSVYCTKAVTSFTPVSVNNA